jgi:hypothetical protein
MKKRVSVLLVFAVIIMFASGCASIRSYISGEEPSQEGVSYVPLEEVPIEGEETPFEEMPSEEAVIEPGEEPAEVTTTAPSTRVPRIIVNETELVSLQLPSTDVDGDDITYTFSQPLNKDGKWQTKMGDAGEYTVTITASDGKLTTAQQIIIEVRSLNKAPVMETIPDMTVNEGDTVSFSPKVVDPEGDKVTITYSGWMTTSSYRTKFTDAGAHAVTITASDGTNQVQQEVKITVKDVNRAPILQPLNDVAVTEGDKVSIVPVAADPDGDKVTITFSEPLDENGEWLTKMGDAGNQRVTVTATDGKLAIEKQFFIAVQSKNKAPVINSVSLSCTGTDVECTGINVNLKMPGAIAKLKLTVSTTDADGDQVTTTFSGWMTSASKSVSYGQEGGSHTVTVSASDGVNTAKKEVTIEVNSAPCIVGFTC